MPSFRQILTGVTQAWNDDRDNVLSSAGEVATQLRALSDIGLERGAIDADVLRGALRALETNFDATFGGFGGAPKFPAPMALDFLLGQHLRDHDSSALAMVQKTLTKMAEGGIYDQIGGGFARYSVDQRWLVPHFEKMLYDNAQLARVYLHAWQVTDDDAYRQVTEETLDYVLREMRHEDGGFYSSQDADSEGVEGKFYVWSAEEIKEALRDDAEVFMRVYGVSEEGNWEGHNILSLHIDPAGLARQIDVDPSALRTRIDSARKTLYETRSKRVWPGLDDKVLTAWNGLMLAAFAEAGGALDRPDYIEAAVANAEFLYRTMRDDSGRLFRTWKAGSEPKYNAYLEDYAYLAEGLIALYETTFDERWLCWARELAALTLLHFRDEENGGFFDTSDDHEALIHRPKDLQDSAVPSGNAVASKVLLKLSLLTGNSDYWQVAEESVGMMVELMRKYPTGFAQWLNAASFMLNEPREVALIGSRAELVPLLEVIRSDYRPFQVTAARSNEEATTVPLLENRPQVDQKPTAYVCRRFVCQAPVTDPDSLAAEL